MLKKLGLLILAVTAMLFIAAPAPAQAGQFGFGISVGPAYPAYPYAYSPYACAYPTPYDPSCANPYAYNEPYVYPHAEYYGGWGYGNRGYYSNNYDSRGYDGARSYNSARGYVGTRGFAGTSRGFAGGRARGGRGSGGGRR